MTPQQEQEIKNWLSWGNANAREAEGRKHAQMLLDEVERLRARLVPVADERLAYHRKYAEVTGEVGAAFAITELCNAVEEQRRVIRELESARDAWQQEAAQVRNAWLMRMI